jgi:hypothetical protein
MPSGADTTTMGESGRLAGSMTVTDSTIDADTTSSAHVTMTEQGPSGNFAIAGDQSTTLTARLQYAADPYASQPFCITGGTLTVVQQQTALGQTQFQGWDLTWTGCNQILEVHRGS